MTAFLGISRMTVNAKEVKWVQIAPQIAFEYVFEVHSVEVVLRHFHRCCYRSSSLCFFCWKGI
jgi:hypothetical protein